MTPVSMLLCALSWAPQVAVQTPVAPLARRAVDLPRAEPGSHATWRDAPLPPLYDLALGAFRGGDIPGAVELLLVLLDRDPDLPPATLMLASIYFKLRRYDDSVQTYGRFLSFAPEEFQRTRHLGHSLYSLGRYGEARAHYERVLAREPDAGGLDGLPRARALRGLGLSLRYLGQLGAAQAALEASTRYAPNDPEAYFALAQVLDERDAVEAAVSQARRVRVLAPFDPRPAFLLATLLDDLGHSDEAAEQRRDFERLAPVDTRTRDLETRLLHAPRDREALLGLAELHASVGDVSRLQRALQRLGSETLEDVVFALEVSGDLDPASAEAAAQLLRRDFDQDHRAWRALAKYYDRRGDSKRGAEAAARASELGTTGR